MPDQFDFVLVRRKSLHESSCVMKNSNLVNAVI